MRCSTGSQWSSCRTGSIFKKYLGVSVAVSSDRSDNYVSEDAAVIILFIFLMKILAFD